MVNMTAGMLDHRNIGSNISLPLDEGTISGCLAVVVQVGEETEIVLAHDDESIILPSRQEIEISLPAAAAYTLHMKNAVEDLLAIMEARSLK